MADKTAKPRTKVGPRPKTVNPLSITEKRCEEMINLFINELVKDIESDRVDENHAFKIKNIFDAKARRLVSTDMKKIMAMIYVNMIEEIKKGPFKKADFAMIDNNLNFKDKSNKLHEVLDKKWGDYNICMFKMCQSLVFSRPEIWDNKKYTKLTQIGDTSLYFGQKIIELLGEELKTCEVLTSVLPSTFVYFVKAVVYTFVKTNWFAVGPKLEPLKGLFGPLFVILEDDQPVDKLRLMMPEKKPKKPKVKKAAVIGPEPAKQEPEPEPKKESKQEEKLGIDPNSYIDEEEEEEDDEEEHQSDEE